MTPSIGRIERSGFAAWSPDETANIGGWAVASSGGFTRRLNSASVVGSADTSLATRDDIASWLAERGAGLTVRITPLIEEETSRSCEANWNLTRVDETRVLVRPTGPPEVADEITIVDASNPDYTTELFEINGRDSGILDSWKRIVQRIGDRAIGLWVPGVAVGFVAVSDQIGSVFSVGVRPEYRRQGLATQIMVAANAWSAENGATSMFLQVVGTNTGAQALYKRLGYVEHYRYHYLQP